MSKIDYKKEFKAFYLPSKKQVVAVDVPAMNYLMIDGSGEPNPEINPDYKLAVEALFSVSYAIKFMLKRSENGIDYGVMPLEGLWWSDDMNDFITRNMSGWKWTLMIMQPSVVTEEILHKVIGQIKLKKNITAIDKLRFSLFTEGKAAQILHIGPFSEEGPTVEKVHAFITESGRKLSGKHHEIYLSDIRKAAPENWKTVIRQPMI